MYNSFALRDKCVLYSINFLYLHLIYIGLGMFMNRSKGIILLFLVLAISPFLGYATSASCEDFFEPDIPANSNTFDSSHFFQCLGDETGHRYTSI